MTIIHFILIFSTFICLIRFLTKKNKFYSDHVESIMQFKICFLKKKKKVFLFDIPIFTWKQSISERKFLIQANRKLKTSGKGNIAKCLLNTAKQHLPHLENKITYRIQNV